MDVDVYLEVIRGLRTMVDKPRHAQGIQFLVKELHPLRAQVSNISGIINCRCTEQRLKIVQLPHYNQAWPKTSLNQVRQ